MNGHETFDTLAAVYAVGALDGDDLARFEAHLAEGCEQCETTLRESREAFIRLVLDAPPAVPPPAVKAALLPRVAGTRRAVERGWLRWAGATAAVVALAAMLTAGIVASRYEARLGEMARETTAVRERLQRAELALREQMAAYRSAVELLRDPTTRVVELRGSGPTESTTARLIWNDKAGGHLLIANLPAPPAGKAYELWTLGGAAPVPAGVFQPDASGRAAQRVEPAAGAPPKGFAVSVEPAAGSTAPSGPIVLASK
jgi:anti-sigma-K factor RskA